MIPADMTSRGNIAEAGRLLDWKPVSAVCFGLLTVIVGSHGFMRPTYLNADPDIMYVYEALLINGGQSQDYFDHTGYLYILLLSVWTRLLHILGLVGPFRLQEFAAMPADAFEAAYHQLVVAGRWLSLIIAGGFIVLLVTTVRRLSGSPLVAAVAALLFAVSPGVVTPALILRPEMLTALFAFASFASLAEAARASGVRMPVLLALAAFLAMAAMMTKVQVVPVLLALPVLAIAFGHHHPKVSFPWHRAEGVWLVLVAALGAAAFGMPALTMIFARAFLHGWPIYQAAIVLGVIVAIGVYAQVYRIDGRTAVIAGASVLAGWSAAQYLHLITNEIQNSSVVASFIEHMRNFASVPGGDTAKSNLNGVLAKALLASSVEPFQPESVRVFPLRVAFWLALPAAAYLLYVRRYRAACQGALLVGLAYAVEVYCTLRSWNPQYYIFATPWLITGVVVMAAAIGERLAPGWRTLRYRHLLVGALVAAIGWTAVHSTLLAFETRRWQDEKNICGQKTSYLHRLPNAFAKSCS